MLVEGGDAGQRHSTRLAALSPATSSELNDAHRQLLHKLLWKGKISSSPPVPKGLEGAATLGDPALGDSAQPMDAPRGFRGGTSGSGPGGPSSAGAGPSSLGAGPGSGGPGPSGGVPMQPLLPSQMPIGRSPLTRGAQPGAQRFLNKRHLCQLCSCHHRRWATLITFPILLKPPIHDKYV